MRRWIVAPVVALFAAGVWAETPAAATSTVTVTVDLALATSDGNECTGAFPPYISCVRYWSGSGLTLDGLREWDLNFTTTESRSCYPGGGTWELTAADGSGDGLSGRLNSTEYAPARMAVSAGTGAYAGAVDTVEFGREQAFAQVVLPTMGFFGCGYGTGLGLWVGSLEFTVTLP